MNRNFKICFPTLLTCSVGVLTSLLLLAPARIQGAADPKLHESQFTVKENGNKIEITSPWGQKNYETEFTLGAMKHYKIEIPIEDLRPAMTPSTDKPDAGRDLASGEGSSPMAPNSCEPNKSTLEVKYGENGERKPASIPDTPTEYDSTDRLMLEANHLYNRGRFYEASVYVEELIRKNPAFVRGWVMKGSLLYMQGYTDLAKKAWAKAAEIDPADPQVKDLQKRYP